MFGRDYMDLGAGLVIPTLYLIVGKEAKQITNEKKGNGIKGRISGRL